MVQHTVRLSLWSVHYKFSHPDINSRKSIEFENLKILKIICRLSLFKYENSSYLWFTWFSSSKWQFRLKNSKLKTPGFSLVLISNIKIFIELFFRLLGPQGQPKLGYLTLSIKAKGKELWPYAALKTRYLALFLVYY